MTSNTPLFSVIIDNYNYSRFLREAIQSVLDQTFSDYELIIIDDHSTDHSVELLAQYRDRALIIELDDNGGQAAAFNAGVAQSRGQFICFLDSDDIFIPCKLERLAQIIKENPNADMYHHQLQFITQDLVPYRKPYPQKPLSGDFSSFAQKYGKPIVAYTSALCFKKEFLDKVFPLEPYLGRLAPDSTLILFVHLLGIVHGIPEALCLYRFHGNNASSYNAKEGDPIVLKQKMYQIEKYYIQINEFLRRKGYDYQVNCNDYLIYQGFDMIVNKKSILNFIKSCILSPIFPTFASKARHIKKLIKWRLKAYPMLYTQKNKGA
ncbi:MAG: glycosyltransferase [Alphaproteobacteria bacterium]|nr:glycosyltransferase [Alphaproteobacteria bacterium]